MNLFTEIAILFTGMTAPVIVCLVVGLIFVIIELFQPGFGIFGIIGGILLLAAIVLRVLVGDGNIVAQIFLMLFFMTIILLIAFVIMVAMSKKGWLTKTPFTKSKRRWASTAPKAPRITPILSAKTVLPQPTFAQSARPKLTAGFMMFPPTLFISIEAKR